MKKIWTAAEREMLFRKTHGKIKLNHYLEILSAFLIEPAQASNLLELAETDRIIKNQPAILQEQKWVFFEPQDKQALPELYNLHKDWQPRDKREILLFVQSLLNKQECYLYWYNISYCCGLYRLDVGSQIHLDYDFAHYKPDDIFIYATDGRFKIHLEYCHEEVFHGEKQDILTNLLECTYQVFSL